MYDSYIGCNFSIDHAVTVELVDRAISDLKRARAAGPDGISAEHLLYSHPQTFDRMNHYGQYIKLMERNIPRVFLDVLLYWYCKCYAVVRWGSFVSQQFHILAGVRQGGVLSPTLFAVYIDSVIKKLRMSGYGTYIGRFYFGCLLYADDIMLVSHSVTAMQLMLDICSRGRIT